MAKTSVKELGRKAEELIEKGNDADQNIQSCQSRVSAASSRVNAAIRQLNEASETDEEGNPKGDVQGAMAQLNMAQNQLAASQRALASARSEAQKVVREKNAHVQEISHYKSVENSNLAKLRQLRSNAFAANSEALTEGIVDRINEAEDARVELLRSMGVDASPDRVSAGSEGGATADWKGGGFGSLDTGGQAESYRGGGGASDEMASKALSTPLGGGLGNLLNRIFGGTPKADTEEMMPVDVPSMSDKRYTSHDELSDEVDSFARDYQANFTDYNSVLRKHQTTDKIERFRKILNSHQIQEDTVFYRRASLKDLGDAFENLSPEDFAGRCYQFEGIMSVSDNTKMAPGNVVFEIKTPAGTPGLDLTKVEYFKEAMFDSPFCLIEGVSKEGNNTIHLTVRILSAGEGLNRVRDFNSLQTYMKSRHGMDLDSSIEKLDITTVKSAISGVESVIKEYPDVGEYLKTGITSYSGVMSCTGNELSFNPEYFSDSSKLHNVCRDMSSRTFWISNSSPVSIGAHEAAHGTEWALIQANPRYNTENERIIAWNNCTEAKTIVRNACENLQKTEYGKEMTSAQLIRTISKYAMENESETMAEAFADVYANGANAKPLSKEIKRLTRALMDNYKGGT